jgi:hypothetical protein
LFGITLLTDTILALLIVQLAEATGQGIAINRDVVHSKSPESRTKRGMTIADVIPLGGRSVSPRSQ